MIWKDGSEKLTVNQTDLIPDIVGAIKELKAENDVLKAEINTLKQRVNALEGK